jgi:hypothetical protein
VSQCGFGVLNTADFLRLSRTSIYSFLACSWVHCTKAVTLYAGFQSHAHLQAGMASLAGTPDAVVSFLDQAHVASRDKVNSPVPSRKVCCSIHHSSCCLHVTCIGTDAAAESAVRCANAYRPFLYIPYLYLLLHSV